MSVTRLRRVQYLAALLVLTLLHSDCTPVRAASSFVSISGTHFTYNGQTVLLKGVNYYPQLNPWSRMFDLWQGPSADKDMATLQGWGVNVIRVLIPYGPGYDWSAADGTVDPNRLANLQQMVQVAGKHNIKLNLTLFDFYDGNAAAGSVEEAHDFTYLRTLITPFANDDRIFAWDLHNEPDNYATWKAGKQAAAVDWLHRMANYVHQLDPHHPVTVGMANYADLFVPAADGSRVADFADFLSLHSYDAINMAPQIRAVRQQSSKPILLQETGWPTGPTCDAISLDYDEAAQTRVYQAAADAVHSTDVAGVFGWTMWDYIPGQSRHAGVDDPNDHYGLMRRDGAAKPALAVFQQIAAPPLPSATDTNLTLTTTPLDFRPVASSGYPFDQPVYFPQTNQYIWLYFHDYWRRFGGVDVFGYPIAPARIETLSDGKPHIVQYFERARLEIHEEAKNQVANWNSLGKAQQLLYIVKLTPLGSLAAAGRNFPMAAPPSTAALAADPTLHYFAETQHTLSGPFYQFWNNHYGIFLFGYPISEPHIEQASDGKPYLVQYFERERFEYHPDNPDPYKVELSLLGNSYFAQHHCP